MRHIGIIAPQFPPDLGGMERYGFEIAAELARRGDRVSVWTTPHGQGEVSLPGDGRVMPTLRGGWYQNRHIIHENDDAVDVWHVMNAAWSWVVFETRKPVVVSVYGNDFLNPNAVAGYDLKRRLGLPMGSRLDFRLARWRTPRVLRKALPKAQHIIACSRYTQRVFVEMFAACRGKTSVAFVGVSPVYFDLMRPSRKADAPPQLLTVCRLSEPRKNVDVVIRALATLRDRFDFTYHVVGDGKLRGELEQLARSVKLSDRVCFHGSVDEATLQAHVAGSDLFILTSAASDKSIEGFGIVYLEANACGTPTLAARVGGAVDAVDEGVSGMFVGEPTDGAVAEAIEAFLAGKVQFDAEACKAFARKFSWPRVVDHVQQCYADVTRGRAGG